MLSTSCTSTLSPSLRTGGTRALGALAGSAPTGAVRTGSELGHPTLHASAHGVASARHPGRLGTCPTRRSLLATLLVFAAVVSGTTGGCPFAGQSRSDTLQDAVHGMVDELRWARPELAADRVAVAYRARFLRSRQHWGERIQVADCDLLSVRLAHDERSATAVVAVSWYALDDMNLRQTRIRQRWELVGGAFVLTSEQVVGGDPSLLGATAPVAVPRVDAALPTDGARGHAWWLQVLEIAEVLRGVAQTRWVRSTSTATRPEAR